MLDLSRQLFILACNCLMALNLIVVLNSVSGVKYHFCSILIGHVYNIVKDRQILLNIINFRSLGNFISLKREHVFNRQEIFSSQRKYISSNLEAIWVYIFFLITFIFHSLKQPHILANFSKLFVIKCINKKNDKFNATFQLGYILLFCQIGQNNIYI